MTQSFLSCGTKIVKNKVASEPQNKELNMLIHFDVRYMNSERLTDECQCLY